MIHWWRRLVRMLGQARIRLPRRELAPEDLRPGDWLQIGGEVWRVSGCEPPPGDRRTFYLTAVRASAPWARLLAAGSRGVVWTLIKDRHPIEVPGGSMTLFPSGKRSPEEKEGC
jgi:hypothetical protein